MLLCYLYLANSIIKGSDTSGASVKISILWCYDIFIIVSLKLVINQWYLILNVVNWGIFLRFQFKQIVKTKINIQAKEIEPQTLQFNNITSRWLSSVSCSLLINFLKNCVLQKFLAISCSDYFLVNTFLKSCWR